MTGSDRYYVRRDDGVSIGPMDRSELEQFQRSSVWCDSFRIVNASKASAVGPGRSESEGCEGDASSERNLRSLVLPLYHSSLSDALDNRRLATVTLAGLAPLLVISVFTNQSSTVDIASWLIAFYVSGLWALFFYYVFPAPSVQTPMALFCFFITGVTSLGALRMWYHIPFVAAAFEAVGAPEWHLDMFGSIVGVGLPEEVTKALILFLIPRPKSGSSALTFMFYGMMSGLGFGIYEGVQYQNYVNGFIAESGHELYLYNFLRMTSLPFIHAIWSGIAGYFVGLSFDFPRSQLRLVLTGILVSAALHGLYNHYGRTVASFGFALISVIILNLYVARVSGNVVREKA